MNVKLHVPVLPLWIALGLVAGCNRDSEDEIGGGGGANDVTPPITVANPPGGGYTTAQTVTLNANEAATVYFTVDGSIPTIGGSSTVSGPSPLGGIQITSSPTTLKFFSIDLAGNVEAVRTLVYTIDANAPAVTIASPQPPPFGLLTEHTLQWSSSEPGNYRIEIGGTGVPGTGTLLALGTVPAGTPQVFQLRGSQIPPGPALTVWVIVIDTSSNVGKASQTIQLKPLATMLYQGEVREIAITPDGKHAYVANALTNAVSVVDIDPTSGNFHQVVAAPVPGVDPSSVAMTPDGTRAYVGSLPGVSAINTVNQGITPIGVPGGFEVRGIDITPDGKRAYFGRASNLFLIDTDPTSANFHASQAVPVSLPGLVFADIELTPSGLLGVLSWQGTSSYNVQIVDLNPGSPTFHSIVGTPVPPASAFFAHVAVSPDNLYGYVANGSKQLARVALTPPYALDLTNPAIGVDNVIVSPDGTRLIVLQRGINALRIVDASDLSLVDNFLWSLCGEAGAITPDGLRLYAVRNDGSPVQELVAVPLQ